MTKRAHTVPKFYLSGFVDNSVEISQEPFLWLGSISDGAVTRKSPKNTSVINSYYDGNGGFEGEDVTLEKHLAGIESEAAKAIRDLAQLAPNLDTDMPPEIGRFLAWQAARTPGWFDLTRKWVTDNKFWDQTCVVEPPPPGLEKAKHDDRLMKVVNPTTGAEISVPGKDMIHYLERGWKWVATKQDRLELMHLQAWYFQVRHFPRLNWTRLTAPTSDAFITSDRAVAWLVDGFADSIPAALRHPNAEVYAPISKSIALVGRNAKGVIGIMPRELNMKVAFCASKWIAGPSEELVRQALNDRRQNHE